MAFMPGLPNWAYNGAALGIGDFSNNAKLTPFGGWERPLQHYRAGLDQSGPFACQHRLSAKNTAARQQILEAHGLNAAWPVLPCVGYH